jgi:hypothetical protein
VESPNNYCHEKTTSQAKEHLEEESVANVENDQVRHIAEKLSWRDWSYCSFQRQAVRGIYFCRTLVGKGTRETRQAFRYENGSTMEIADVCLVPLSWITLFQL